MNLYLLQVLFKTYWIGFKNIIFSKRFICNLNRMHRIRYNSSGTKCEYMPMKFNNGVFMYDRASFSFFCLKIFIMSLGFIHRSCLDCFFWKNNWIMNSFVDNFLIFLHFLSMFCANFKIKLSDSIKRINRFKRIIWFAYLVSNN